MGCVDRRPPNDPPTIVVTVTTAGGHAALVLARNPANRRLLAEVLADAGLDVSWHEDPDSVHGSLATGERPHLALVDVDGFSTDVWDACEALVSADAAVVVIAGSRTEEVQEATLGLGVRTVLEKPLRRANVQALVRTLADDR